MGDRSYTVGLMEEEMVIQKVTTLCGMRSDTALL